jgi:hypothetical protein
MRVKFLKQWTGNRNTFTQPIQFFMVTQ